MRGGGIKTNYDIKENYQCSAFCLVDSRGRYLTAYWERGDGTGDGLRDGMGLVVLNDTQQEILLDATKRVLVSQLR